MNFKIGDWVVERSTGELKQIKVSEPEDTIRKLTLYERLCDKWQPKEGEWCWLKTDKTLKLFKFNQPAFNQAFYHGYNPLIEPFIGTLPSFIKEIK